MTPPETPASEPLDTYCGIALLRPVADRWSPEMEAAWRDLLDDIARKLSGPGFVFTIDRHGWLFYGRREGAAVPHALLRDSPSAVYAKVCAAVRPLAVASEAPSFQPFAPAESRLIRAMRD